MAAFDIDFPENYIADLLETDFDAIAQEALADAAPILEESVKKEVRKVISHDGDSELANSFKATKPKKTKNGAWIANVTPRGYSKDKVYVAVDSKGKRTARKYSVSNALKAIWKEYGIPGRQVARPFITAFINASKQDVMKRMQEVYNKKVGAGSGIE